MDSEELRRLIRQPEGLKLDFKRKFYDVNNIDQNTKKRQIGELVKDLLALANGNVNTVGETAHLIIGIGDKIRPDGTREVFDVGDIDITARQILEILNSFCNPPIPDLRCEMLLLDRQRVFVISIPPSPHVHQTTRRIETSSGVAYPENSIFIRRGESIHIASLDEITALVEAKKQKNTLTYPAQFSSSVPQSDLPSSKLGLSSLRVNWLSLTCFIIVTLIVIMATVTTPSTTQVPLLAIGIIGLLIGMVIALIFIGIQRFVHWLINRHASRRWILMASFWAPVVLGFPLGIGMTKDPSTLPVNILVGLIFGTLAGLLFFVLAIAGSWVILALNRRI